MARPQVLWLLIASIAALCCAPIQAKVRLVAVVQGELEFWVHSAADAGLGTMVSGKVFNGSLKVGDVLHRAVIGEATHSVNLRVEEISIYGFLVDELNAALSGQVLMTGEGADLLAQDVLLYRS